VLPRELGWPSAASRRCQGGCPRRLLIVLAS
jgi:hypothetical protein